MRLSMDPSSWGVDIMRELKTKLPAIGGQIQFVDILDQDPEGNGYGIIPLAQGSAFIPFVVRDFELKPLDILVAIEDGQEKFRRLTDATAVMAMGGISLGKPMSREPVGVSVDQEISMLPPRAQIFGRRLPPYGVLQSVSPVKLGSTRRLDKQATEKFFKQAKQLDESLPRFLAEQYLDSLEQLIDKEASAQVVVFEPTRRDTVKLWTQDKQAGEIPLAEVGQLFRDHGLTDAPQKIAALLAGELVAEDLHKQASEYSFTDPDKKPLPEPITKPGWYQHGSCLVRAFQTRQLDGAVCSQMLLVHPDGHSLARYHSGVPMDTPGEDVARPYYQPADLTHGEFCFLVDEESDEASVPFRILSRTNEHGGNITLVVRPLLGDAPTETLRLGNNRRRYRLGYGEIAIPLRGHAIFKLHPGNLDHTGWKGTEVRVRLFKGGGVYDLKEDGRPADRLTRGQLVARLIHRYGMSPTHALATLRQADQYLKPEFSARAVEPGDDPEQGEPAVPMPSSLAKEATDVALGLWRLLKRSYDERQSVSSGAAPIDLNPARSGPNRTEGPVGPSGPGPAVNGGVAMAPAPTPPDLPFLKEVADTLSGFATGQFSSSELSEVYSSLMDQLLGVQDQAGRLLILARLGKIDFVTEAEAKKLVDEADKFRSSLLNADMLLKGTTGVV